MSFPTKEFTHAAFDEKKPAVYGSIREKKVNPDLQEERDKCNFDQKELTRIIYGNDIESHENLKKVIGADKDLQPTFEFYEMTREEMMERSQMQMKKILSNPEIKSFHQSKSLTTLMMDYMQGQVRRLIVYFSDTCLILYDYSSPSQSAYPCSS